MKVKFKKLRENAKLPTKNYEGDFCYDVYACDCIEVSPGVYKYPLGFAVQIEEGEQIYLETGTKQNELFGSGFLGMGPNLNIKQTAILSLDFRPRSSIYKTGMSLCNACGTVDRNYTGEVCAFFYHVKTDLPKYEAGERVAQMKIGLTVPIEFVEVEELNETDRGAGGFGSTGKN